MSERGTIERTSTGWAIKPGVWSEPKAAPQPDARLETGRIVRVTFNLIVGTTGTRDEIEEEVTMRLNEQFDLTGDPMLEDLGMRTDAPELLERALSESVARSAQRAGPAEPSARPREAK